MFRLNSSLASCGVPMRQEDDVDEVEPCACTVKEEPGVHFESHATKDDDDDGERGFAL